MTTTDANAVTHQVESAPQIGEPVACGRLEVALDSMVDKLKDFHAGLDADERAALMELLESAATHTDSIQARDEGELAKLVYDKPIQVHATYSMKEKMRTLPELIREREGE
ncbi:MAG: hypothetical protein ACRDTE_14600 [Pseudonocardiaceae bacterium]